MTSNSPAAANPAIPAATVMMLRSAPAGGGLEVFMVVRHHQIDFASGALVFPGGKVAPGDADPLVRQRSQGCDQLDDQALLLQAAAIREAFEECGILLARPKGDANLVAAEQLLRLNAWREPLERGDQGLAEFLEQEDLELACDRMVRFAHWITPDMMPKRFDTHFYLAEAPSDHLAAHDGRESVDSVWISPEQALAEAAKGQRTVIFPTARNLEKLAQYSSPAEAMAAAAATPVVTVQPWTEKRDDGVWLRIQEAAGYLVNEEKMPGR